MWFINHSGPVNFCINAEVTSAAPSAYVSFGSRFVRAKPKPGVRRALLQKF